jgi:pre-60S factor REI1
MSSSISLTSTTAPGKVFSSRSELADHYKSDWHKYNLKRREAGLPLLEEQEFRARWEAALALRQEKEKATGRDHLKLSSKRSGKKHHKDKPFTQQHQQQQQQASTSKSPVVAGGETETPAAANSGGGGDDVTMEDEEADGPADAAADAHESPEIDPKQSLFDSHRSDTLEGNVAYMQRKYGFFIPDQGKRRSLSFFGVFLLRN